jgi:sugar phosphate isomerase/epimerase
MKPQHILAAFRSLVTLVAPDTAASRPLSVYDFGGLKKLAPAERADPVAKTGYAGLVFSSASAGDVENLRRDLARCADPAGRPIMTVFVRSPFMDPPTDIARRGTVVRLIAGRNSPLWIILDNRRPGITTAEAALTAEAGTGRRASAKARSITTAETRDAAEHHVPLARHPPSRCWIRVAEEALTMLNKIDRPEVSIVLDLGHELRAHKGGRLAEVARKVGYLVSSVGDRVSVSSVSGAAAEVDFPTLGTIDRTTISSLEESAFDWAGGIATCDAASLRLPVAFINFKIPAPVTDYLPRSLAPWCRVPGSCCSPTNSPPTVS